MICYSQTSKRGLDSRHCIGQVTCWVREMRVLNERVTMMKKVLFGLAAVAAGVAVADVTSANVVG